VDEWGQRICNAGVEMVQWYCAVGHEVIVSCFYVSFQAGNTSSLSLFLLSIVQEDLENADTEIR
jgi:hypothetical protein